MFKQLMLLKILKGHNVQLIPIQALPYQSLSIQVDQNNYNLRITTCKNIMAIDVIRNNITLLTGQRLVCGTLVMPYAFMEAGNFLLLTNNDSYPYYTEFGLSQFLIYFSQLELETIRAEV